MTYMVDPSRIVNRKSHELNAKLDLVARKLDEHYNDAGQKLVYHLGHWRILQNGRYEPLDESGLEQFHRTVGQICRDVGLTYGRIVKRQLRASRQFAPYWPPFDGQARAEFQATFDPTNE
jgi:hypothetical protein